MRARRNLRAPGGKRDAFRFAQLEQAVATVVHPDGDPLEAFREAALALRPALVSGDLPRIMAVQRLTRALALHGVEDARELANSLPRFGDVPPVLAVVPGPPTATGPRPGGQLSVPTTNEGEPSRKERSPSVPQKKESPLVSTMKTALAPSYEVVSFANVRSREPVPQSVTWSELVGMLADVEVASAKDAVMLWSPVSYLSGTSRGLRNVESVSLIVQDFDDGTHWDDVLPRWSGHAYIVHTSWSHTKEHPKWRLVLPLSAPVPASDWARVWRWADERSGGADPACKDPSRIYYVPAAPKERLIQFVHLTSQGSPVAPPIPTTKPKARKAWGAAVKKTQATYSRRDGARPGEVYKVDAAARQALGERLGGRVQGQAIKRVPCPQCGKRSVAWYIEPGTKLQAWCNHRNSCGWSGWLDQLGAS